MTPPRIHATNILMIDTKQGRVDYLDKNVPEHLKHWVRHYVHLWWPRRAEFLEEIENKKNRGY